MIDGGVELSGGDDWFLVARRDYQPGHVAGAVHFAVKPEDALQFLGGSRVDDVGGRAPTLAVHPHVERGVEAEGEASAGRVELVGRHSEVGDDSVHAAAPECENVVVDETEIVVYKRKTRIVDPVAQSVAVTIEGEEFTPGG